MKKKFVDNVLVYSKDLVELEISQLNSRPQRLVVGLTLTIEDLNEKEEVLSPGEMLHYLVSLKIRMYDADNVDPEKQIQEPVDEDKALVMEGTIDLGLQVVNEIRVKKSLAEEYQVEILSFVYDDLRIILEENISKTTFRGFRFPSDFRMVLQSNTNDF